MCVAAVVQEGIASPADIDKVARLTFGLRLPAMGPLENMDIVGVNPQAPPPLVVHGCILTDCLWLQHELIHSIHEYLLEDLCDAKAPLPLYTRMVETGETGAQHSGSGFYAWQPQGGGEKRSVAGMLERRDQQIVRQLAYLRETDNL